MIKDNQKVFNRIHIFIDGLLVALSYISAYYLRFYLLSHWTLFRLGEHEKFYPFHVYAKYLILLVPVYMILYSVFNLYKSHRSSSRRILVWNLFEANALGLMVFAFALYLTKEIDFSRWFFIVFAITNMIFDLILRFII